LGISLWLDEFLSRAACGNGRFGRGFRDSCVPVSGFAAPLFTGHIRQFEFTFTVAQPLAAFIVLAVTAVNYLSVQMNGAIQILLTSLKMGAIVHCLGGILFGAKHAAPFRP